MAEQSITKEQINRFTSFGLCEMKLVDPDQNKKRYYCILLQPGLFDITLQRQWGRLGSRPRVKDEFCEDINEALKRANRLYREKVKKGYREF